MTAANTLLGSRIRNAVVKLQEISIYNLETTSPYPRYSTLSNVNL